MVQKQPVLICILGFTTVFCVPKYIICLGEETTVKFAGSTGTYMTQFLLNRQEMLTWMYFIAMFKVYFLKVYGNRIFTKRKTCLSGKVGYFTYLENTDNLYDL